MTSSFRTSIAWSQPTHATPSSPTGERPEARLLQEAGLLEWRPRAVLANRGRTERLALCRVMLAVWTVVQVVGAVVEEAGAAPARRRPCPACGAEQWQRVAELPRTEGGDQEQTEAAVGWPDTS